MSVVRTLDPAVSFDHEGARESPWRYDQPLSRRVLVDGGDVDSALKRLAKDAAADLRAVRLKRYFASKRELLRLRRATARRRIAQANARRRRSTALFAQRSRWAERS